MSLATAIRDLVLDIDQLSRLYLQLRDVPQPFLDLFDLLGVSRGHLLEAERHLAKADAVVAFQHDIRPFRVFRTKLLDLELFMDPAQVLHRSGPEVNTHKTVPWNATDNENTGRFCLGFQTHILILNSSCDRLLQFLRFDPPIRYTTDSSSPDTELYLPQKTPQQVEGFREPSPLELSSALEPVNSQPPTPALRPESSTIPIEKAPAYMSPPATVGIFNRSPSAPSIAASTTSSKASPSSSSRHKPKKKPEHLKTAADKKIEQLLEQYATSTVGVKRKRSDKDTKEKPYVSRVEGEVSPDIDSISPGSVPLSRLPSVMPDSNIKHGDVSAWSLGQLNESLPPPSAPNPYTSPIFRPQLPPLLPLNKGKQRAFPEMAPAIWDSSSSSFSGSSANSIRSSTREGSIMSFSCRDFSYNIDSCKLWYNQGTTSHQLSIQNIEVRRQNRPTGESTVVVTHTTSGQDIVDDLWMSSLNINSSPFLENSDVVAAFRKQDKNIKYVVRFAPNTARHPRYSFSTRDECWDFMEAIVKMKLSASVDVESIKSACTHGNAVESGCETLQIWEDPIHSSKRTIKFFRNKNASAMNVVEFDSNSLRAPEKERKTGKLIFAFRDVQGGPTKDMKYLKIAFSNDEAKQKFLEQTRFSR